MQRFSVNCLGIGPGTPCASRNHSAFLYDLNGVRLLVDCGEPLCRVLKAGGHDFESIDRVLISHYHCDHIGGFFMFIQGCWLENRRKPLPVHLPAVGLPAVRQILQAACLFEEMLPFSMEFEAWQAGRPLELSDLRITPFLTTHLKDFQREYEAKYPGHFDAFAFLMETGGRRICHTADLGAPEDLDGILEDPLDLLVCELAHFEPDALFTRLDRAEIETVVLTHLSESLWEQRAEVKRQAESQLPGKKVVLAGESQSIFF